MVNETELEDPNAIPNYLEQVFKQKEKDKMKMKMMGDDIDMKDKIRSHEEDSNIQYVDTKRFQKNKMEEKYM